MQRPRPTKLAARGVIRVPVAARYGLDRYTVGVAADGASNGGDERGQLFPLPNGCQRARGVDQQEWPPKRRPSMNKLEWDAGSFDYSGKGNTAGVVCD
jgi:hypothetical protein